jgi:hypothetical protein
MCGSADTSQAEAAMGVARQKAEQALQDQVKARADSVAAADAGSETARLAQERAIKRMAAGGMFGAASNDAAAPPPVATRQLFGS